MYGTFFKVFPKDIESYVLQNFVFIINQFITHLCSVQTHAKTCTRFLRIGRKSALNSLQSLIHSTYVALIVKLRDYCTFNRLRWAIDKYTNCSHGNGDDDDHDQFGPIPRAYIIHLSLHNCIRDISESHFPVGTSPCPTTPLTTDPHATPLSSPPRHPGTSVRSHARRRLPLLFRLFCNNFQTETHKKHLRNNSPRIPGDDDGKRSQGKGALGFNKEQGVVAAARDWGLWSGGSKRIELRATTR